MRQASRLRARASPERRGGTVLVRTPDDAAVHQELGERGIICDFRPGAGVRLGPHFYNSEDELESHGRGARRDRPSGAYERHTGAAPVLRRRSVPSEGCALLRIGHENASGASPRPDRSHPAPRRAGVGTAAQLVDRNATGVKIRRTRRARRSLTYRKGGARQARARLGRDQRDRAEGGRAPGRSSSSTTRAAGASTTRCTGRLRLGRAASTTVRRCRTSSPPARRPTGRTGPRRAGRSRFPDLGFTPWLPELSAKWLEVSHWTGSSRSSRARTGSTRAVPELFGRITYKGQPVYGFGTTRFGAPTDGFGGSSTSTRTTRCTAQAGGARTRSSRTTRPASSVTASTLRPDEGRLQASARIDGEARPRQRRGVPPDGERPGVTPNIATIVDGAHPYDRRAADVARQERQSRCSARGATRRARPASRTEQLEQRAAYAGASGASSWRK